MGLKKEIFERMRLCEKPILWVNPLSIPFVRANWEDVPLGVAEGDSRVFILNGDNSFKITNTSYSSNKLSNLRSEEVIRKVILKDFEGCEKYFMEDFIYKNRIGWSSWNLQDIYDRSCRAYWFDKRRTADIHEIANKYGLSGMRPKYFFQDNLEYFVGKNPIIKYSNNYNDPVGESYLGQTCTINMQGRFWIDNVFYRSTFAGATNIIATFSDGTVIEGFPEMYLQPII
jgi:hypothetical protein